MWPFGKMMSSPLPGGIRQSPVLWAGIQPPFTVMKDSSPAILCLHGLRAENHKKRRRNNLKSLFSR
jgi:hypothetical protein